ncbi:MAG: SPOR domain-containing protein [Sulfuricaulis sp.]|nr:SPOR domain-containing protein [Sulfuricaulis sp.]
MADRNDARPEFNPKYRIVGAIVLVALVVIFVPMVLNEREPPAELKGATEAPARKVVADTKLVVAPVRNEETRDHEVSGVISKTITVPVAAESTQQTETKPAAPADKPAAAKKTTTEPAPEKSAKVSAPAEKITKGWIVQVGTFSNSENSIHLRDKLKSHGHTVHTETVTVAGKMALRLRVGPFHNKEQAAKAQAQIRKETGVPGAVQSYP